MQPGRVAPWGWIAETWNEVSRLNVNYLSRRGFNKKFSMGICTRNSVENATVRVTDY